MANQEPTSEAGDHLRASGQQTTSGAVSGALQGVPTHLLCPGSKVPAPLSSLALSDAELLLLAIAGFSEARQAHTWGRLSLLAQSLVDGEVRLAEIAVAPGRMFVVMVVGSLRLQAGGFLVWVSLSQNRVWRSNSSQMQGGDVVPRKARGELQR